MTKARCCYSVAPRTIRSVRDAGISRQADICWLAKLLAKLRRARFFRKQDAFVMHVTKTFRRIDVPKNGHCLFSSFVVLFDRYGMTCTQTQDAEEEGVPFTVRSLRGFCADELLRTEGNIPGMLYVAHISSCRHHS